MSYTPYNTAAGWKAINQGNCSDQQKIAIDTLGALTDPSGAFGKETASVATIPITVGAKDSIVFDDYAGKKILAVAGLKPAGTLQIINQASGFDYTAANIFDAAYIMGSSINLTSIMGSFNLNMSFTGVGSSAEWDTGYFDNVIICYVDGYTASNNNGMILFTTVAGQTNYLSSAMNGVTSGLVVYGQLILDPSQYTFDGTGGIDLVLDDAVEAGLQLIIIPS